MILSRYQKYRFNSFYKSFRSWLEFVYRRIRKMSNTDPLCRRKAVRGWGVLQSHRSGYSQMSPHPGWVLYAGGPPARNLPSRSNACPDPLPFAGHYYKGEQLIVKTSIICADDNIQLRKFLKMTIQEDPNLSVINEAGDGLELLGLLKETTPDIVVLDISMPALSGLDAAEIIKKLYPQIKIVMLTMHQRKGFFHRACEIGVDGYVLKDELEEINLIINSVLQGRTYISPCFSVKIES
jgi:CheY-like chemotaxis protein